MKKIIVSLLLVFTFLSGFSQEKEELVIFENTKNWRQEIIKFPIDWTPKLKITGFKELLFPPNKSDPKNENFWSLIFGWKINSDRALKLKEIEYNLYAYFDGLMKPNHWASKFPEPKVSLQKVKNGFTGKMTFFDGLHTGKILTVNILGEQHFYKELKKFIIVFRLSPKEFNHEIWNNLNEIELKKHQ